MGTGSVVLDRHLTLETLEFEAPSGTRDRAGVPEYDDAVSFRARAVRKDDVVARTNGEEIRTELELIIPGGQDNTPRENARVTRNAATFIVEDVTESVTRKGVVMFYRLKCRSESRG